MRYLQAHLPEILEAVGVTLHRSFLFKPAVNNSITEPCQGLGHQARKTFRSWDSPQASGFKSISHVFLKWFSTLNALRTYWWLNCMTLPAFYDQLRATILTIIPEESWFSALGAINGQQQSAATTF
jgi:hypothetical protein